LQGGSGKKKGKKGKKGSGKKGKKGAAEEVVKEKLQWPWFNRLQEWMGPSEKTRVRYAFSDRKSHSRMPLDPTHVRLKLEHACDQ
jgi:hypothetical protein